MPASRNADAVFDEGFLTARAKLLELAAWLDRIDAVGPAPEGDDRWRQLREAIELLGRPAANRTEQMQLVFSLPYAQDWREDFAIEKR